MSDYFMNKEMSARAIEESRGFKDSYCYDCNNDSAPSAYQLWLRMNTIDAILIDIKEQTKVKGAWPMEGDDMTDELQPCPLCGKDATEIIDDGGDYPSTYYGCFNCNLLSYSAKEWNTRPIEDALRAQIPRWIPVTERLPETNGWYLCCIYGYTGAYARFHRLEPCISVYYLDGEWMIQATVTHWMPLPEVPG